MSIAMQNDAGSCTGVKLDVKESRCRDLEGCSTRYERWLREEGLRRSKATVDGGGCRTDGVL